MRFFSLLIKDIKVLNELLRVYSIVLYEINGFNCSYYMELLHMILIICNDFKLLYNKLIHI